MLTYEYKLYHSKRNRKVDAMLREACFVWNHALALQRRYYSLYGRYCSAIDMQKHFARRIERHRLHSQSVQEILQRQDAAYRRFFNHLSARPPKFKRASDFSSIVWKQGGYKLNANVFVVNSIKQHFQFSFSRPYEGKVRQVRIKRSHLGEYYLYIVTDAVAHPYGKSHDGASVGMDFGLKTYLTLSDGTRVENPLFLKQGLKDLRRASRRLSKCEKGSSHRRSARLALDRIHEDITNRRDDWQWKLSHELCRAYDTLCIEDLQLTGMSRLWGRKMSDLAFGSSMQLRSKKELIENFISSVNAGTDVGQSWRDFVRRQKEEDLKELIESESLKPEETVKFIESSFRDGQVRTTGTDIDRILPPMSRFGGGNRQEKKKSVIDKIQAFFERYFGL